MIYELCILNLKLNRYRKESEQIFKSKIKNIANVPSSRHQIHNTWAKFFTCILACIQRLHIKMTIDEGRNASHSISMLSSRFHWKTNVPREQSALRHHPLRLPSSCPPASCRSPPQCYIVPAMLASALRPAACLGLADWGWQSSV